MTMKLSGVNLWVGLLLTLMASPVLAGSDTFHLGTGRDGVLVASQPGLQVNRYARVKLPLASGDVAVQVDSAEGFAAGDLVMVLQTTGLVPAAVPGSVAPMDLGHDAVGRWELARLASVDGDVLSLTASLFSSYAAEVSQVIRVPEFTSVHVQPGASLVAQPWNGATGGVLAFLATGSLLNEGRIDVSGMGFRGGSPTVEETGCSSAGSTGEGVDSTTYGRASGPENVANGGGGGTCRGRAGGGGGNASAGGQAGLQPWRAGGMGGAPLVYSMLDHLTLGGGGGGGYVRGAQLENEAEGGRGGGAIFIRAGALDGNGAISASGATGGFSVFEGPGGGGAGGSILVRLAGAMRCGGLHAEGGRGGASLGSAEPVSGGGGGSGRVLYQASSVTGCPVFAGAWLSDSWSEAPDASAEGSVTALPGGFIRPEAATILWPGNGSTVDTSRPAILGRASTGMEVIVYLDGAEAGRVVAEGGLFSFTPDQPLVVGKHAVQVESSYQAIQSGRSSPNVFMVKRLPDSMSEGALMPPLLAAPTVTSIAGKASSVLPTAPTQVSSLRPHLVGRSDPETTQKVEIFIKGGDGNWKSGAEQTLFAKAYNVDGCSGAGTCRWEWNITPYADLGTVQHKLVVSADSDISINGTYYFQVDRSPPTPPFVSPLGTTKDKTPTITGSFTEQGDILISIDGVQKGPVSVTKVGGDSWTYDWPDELGDGDHSLQVIGRDLAGNPSTATIVRFTVDTKPPSAPAVTYLNGVAVPDSTTPVKIGTTTPSIKGFAEPKSTVVVSSAGAPDPVGSVKADDNGAWVIASLMALPPGSAGSAGTLSIRASDELGNGPGTSVEVKYYVDTERPDLQVTSVGGKTSVTSGSTLKLNLKRPSITGTLNKPGSVTVTLTNSGGGSPQTFVVTSPAGATMPWTWSVSPMSDLVNGASYTVTVTARDEIGNPSSPTSRNYTLVIDLVPPQTKVISCPTKVGASAPYQFTFGVEVAEPGVTYQCRVDAEEYKACSNPYSIASSEVAVGDRLLLARAVDEAGNIDETPISCFWTVSDSAFVILFDRAPSEYSPFSTANFAVDATRVAPAYQCRLKKAGADDPVEDWDDCEVSKILETDSKGTLEFPGLTDGTYTLDLEASAGTETAKKSFTWTVDLGKPGHASITVPSMDGLFLNTATPTLKGSGRSLGTDRLFETFTVRIHIDEEADETPDMEFDLPPGKSWETTLPRLADRSHFVVVQIRDEAGNLSVLHDDAGNPLSRRQFFVDTLPPETAITSVLPGKLTNVPSAVFSFSSPTDDSEEAAAAMRYECNLDETGFGACNGLGTFSHTVGPFTGDLTHTLQIRARDRAENVDPSPVQYTWRVDTVPPETFIESGPPSLTNSPAASFRFNSEAGATFECRRDDEPSFTSCPSSHSYIGLGHGKHVLRVKAKDMATNVDDSAAVYEWEVDLNPPATPEITWPEAGVVLSKAFPEVRGTAEPGSKVDVFLGDIPVGSAITNSLGTWKVALELAVSDGEYELKAWGADAAGNEALEPATRTVMVDATPPETSIVEGPSGRVRTTTAPFQFSSPESEVTFECSLDYSSFEECSATMQYEVPAGEHNLRVRALDRVKNADESPASRTWQVYLGGDSKVTGGGLSCSTTTGGSSVLATLWVLGLAVFSARRSRR